MVKNLAVFVSLFCALNSIAQERANEVNREMLIESINYIQKDNPVDSVLQNKYSTILTYYTKQNLKPDSIIYYGNSLLSEFKSKIDEFPEIVNATLNYISVAYWYKSNYKKAKTTIQEKMKLFPNQSDQDNASDLMNLGLFNIELGEYIEGIDCLFKSEKIILKLLDDKNQNNPKESLFENLSTIYINLGLAFENVGDSKKAISYYEKSIEYLYKSGYDNPDDLGSLYVNIGNQYTELKKYDQAKTYFDFAYNELENIKVEKIKGQVKYNIGSLHDLQGNIEEAELFYLEAIEHFNKQGSNNEEGRSARNLAQLYINTKEAHRAKYYLDLAEKKFEISKSKRDIAFLSKSYAEYYELVGDMSNAYRYLQKYFEIADDLVNDKVRQESLKKEFNKDLERQQYIDSLEKVKSDEINNEKLRRKDLEISAKRNQQIILGSGLFISAILLFFVFKRHRQNLKQKLIIENQHSNLRDKNEEILDSINYAKRLQDAILPSKKLIKKHLHNSFILFKPKDVVSGDFYFMDVVEESNSNQNGKKLVYYVAADCTGHGVPGAMVSIVGANGLKRCIQEFGLRDPGEILDKLAQIVAENFSPSEEKIRDGMDLALCCLEMENDETVKVHYAGANNPLWVINSNRKTVPESAKVFKEGGGFEIKANKQAIGYTENISPFTTHTFEVEEGDTLYTFSDGYPDQFGGENGKKYKSANFRKFLLSIQDENLDKQKRLVSEEFENWKGKLEQIDDVCVIGVRL